MELSPILVPLFGISCGIVAIVAGAVFKPWLRYQERRMELEAQMVAEKAAQYAAQTERLEQRVRVLERIVTDRGHDLAGEIESLRDEQPAIGARPVN